MSTRATMRGPVAGGSTRPVTPGLCLAGGLLVLCGTALLVPAPAAGSDRPPVRAEQDDSLPSILVEVRTATWKPRGRILFDVTATVRNRLSSAGFPIVRDAAQPRDLTLTLDYREKRGRQYNFTTYQTIVIGRFQLESQDSSRILDLRVQEQSGQELGGTPPYIDAIQRFETHPSVYFVGDIVKGILRGEPDRALALIAGLRRELETESSGIDPLGAPHTMTAEDSALPQLARQRAIEELGQLGGPQVVPFLRDLRSHKDPEIQQAARHALDRIEAQDTAEHKSMPSSHPSGDQQ